MRGIAVNKKWGADPKAFSDGLASDVESNWHPVGTDSIKAVVDHELGHQLDALLDLSQDAEIFALWNEGQQAIAGVPLALTTLAAGLSRYATTNIKEMIAEGWAEYRNNPQPREMATRIGEIVERRYRDRHPP